MADINVTRGNSFGTFDLGAAYRDAEYVKTMQQRRQMLDTAQAQEAQGQQDLAHFQEKWAELQASKGNPEWRKRIADTVRAGAPQFADASDEELVRFAEVGLAQKLGIEIEQPEAPKPDRRVVGGRLVEVGEEGDVRELYAAPEKPPEPRQPPKPGYGAPQKGVNPTTGKPDQYVLDDFGNPKWLGIAPVNDGPSTKDVQGLRKEYRSLPTVKSFEETLPLLVSARNAPDNGYGDLQLIYTAGKLLDPGSVVREGEVALAIAAGSPIQRVLGITAFNAEAGGRLTPKARQQLLGMLNERVLSYRQAYERDRTEYRRYAAEQGINPNDVIGTHPADAYSKGASPKAAPNSKFEVGKLYEDAQGNKAIYLGRDKRGKEMWQEPR